METNEKMEKYLKRILNKTLLTYSFFEKSNDFFKTNLDRYFGERESNSIKEKLDLKKNLPSI